MPMHAVISGASIAGPALAHELNARGWRTTVLEQTAEFREEGQNVDVRGAGREVLRRMGLEEVVLAASTTEVGLRFVDDGGKEIAAFPAGQDDTSGATAEMEVLRGQLARILYDRTREQTDYRFATQIEQVHDGEPGRNGAGGVAVALSDGTVLDADVLVVAEGTRSRTRALLFDDVDGGELDELGLYVAYLAIERTAQDDRWWTQLNATGSRAVGLRPDNVGSTRASLTFLSGVRGLESLSRRDQIEVLRRTFADVGWQAPRILDALDSAPYYFDAVAQVHARTWSRGRTVLLGDAAWSPGPFGTGTSLALVGAHVLAGELATTESHAAAFAGYEAVMRAFAGRAQDVSPLQIRALNPASRPGLAAQRTGLRAASAAVTGPLGGLLGKVGRPPTDAIELPTYRASRTQVEGTR